MNEPRNNPIIICVLLEPTEKMLEAARDWSHTKYGKAIGNEDAKGCWQAMIKAIIN